MTVLERKARFVKAILDESTSEAMLADLEMVLSLISSEKEPCGYSPEELRQRARQGIEDAKKGKGRALSDIRKKQLSV